MNKKIRTNNHHKLEKGQSLLEVAFSLTFMLILLAGAVDVGRIFIAYISMRDAAQEGIAFGSVFPTYCNQIVARTISSSTNMFQPQADMVTVYVGGVNCPSADETQACIGNEITLTITNPAYPMTMPFLGAALGKQTIPLSVTVSDTILRPPCP
jgi:hypothetical protein